MARREWAVVPCLGVLRSEFDRVSPHRDKGADGTIGNSEHTSASDHSPDEESTVLAGKDADGINEVHGLDIDSSGPWPAPGWFDRAVLDLVAREKAEFESATIVGRLQYVIWNKRIASRSWGWVWRPHTGKDPHTNHAHFSARYTSAQERDIRPWGVYREADMTPAEMTAWAKSPEGRDALGRALIGTMLGASGPTVGVALQSGYGLAQRTAAGVAALPANLAQLASLVQTVAARDDVDEAEVATQVLAGLSADAIASAVVARLPADQARLVADELHARLAA